MRLGVTTKPCEPWPRPAIADELGTSTVAGPAARAGPRDAARISAAAASLENREAARGIAVPGTVNGSVVCDRDAEHAAVVAGRLVGSDVERRADRQGLDAEGVELAGAVGFAGESVDRHAVPAARHG